MKPKKSKIKNYDSQIFSTLYRAKRPLAVKKIADRVGISWPTANLYVNRLNKMKVVRIKKTVRLKKVEIRPDFLKKWQKQLSV